jgi:hypothetical protein
MVQQLDDAQVSKLQDELDIETAKAEAQDEEMIRQVAESAAAAMDVHSAVTAATDNYQDQWLRSTNRVARGAAFLPGALVTIELVSQRLFKGIASKPFPRHLCMVVHVDRANLYTLYAPEGLLEPKFPVSSLLMAPECIRPLSLQITPEQVLARQAEKQVGKKGKKKKKELTIEALMKLLKLRTVNREAEVLMTADKVVLKVKRKRT